MLGIFSKIHIEIIFISDEKYSKWKLQLKCQHHSSFAFSSRSIERTKCIFHSILYPHNTSKWKKIEDKNYIIENCNEKKQQLLRLYIFTSTPLKRWKCISHSYWWPIILVSVVQKEAFRPLSTTYHCTRTMPLIYILTSCRFSLFWYDIWNLNQILQNKMDSGHSSQGLVGFLFSRIECISTVSPLSWYQSAKEKAFHRDWS